MLKRANAQAGPRSAKRGATASTTEATSTSHARDSAACLLTINGGSSSIKFALYSTDQTAEPLLSGKIDQIGMPGTCLSFNDTTHPTRDSLGIQASDHRSAGNILIDWLEQRIGFASVRAVGHRVVHGGARYSEPQRVTQELLDELRRISPYDPEHLPAEVELIEIVGQRYPDLVQVACFDTAFHWTMPRVARILAIPRRFDTMGVQRYGFHGLSYAYLVEELARVAGVEAARGRVILAHLGNGASLAAVRGGESIETSMGFTPTAGLPMGTRSGDLDPGLVWYLMRTEQMTAKQFHDLVNHQSGLLGVSEISSDIRDLLTRQATDTRAAEAVELFCYQTRKWIGAFAAILSGLDTLVFAGGIGENVPEVRERICTGLEFLGIELDAARNAAHAPVISTDASPATVRTIRTNEELMIAKTMRRILYGED